MVLSASATHALRALARLAASEPREVTLGRDLAAEISVPAHYLAKVLATLARVGLLAASRGARGGYRLARPPDQIALMEIVEPFEGKRVRPGCLLRPDQPCSEETACAAHGHWSEVKETYLRFLETTTLADIRGAGVEKGRRGRPAKGAPQRPRRRAGGRDGPP